jgi:hypothetical protein
VLAEFIARRDLRVQNRGSEPTFARGDSKSDIDVTFTARTSVLFWKVCNDWEVTSDDVPILFEVGQTKEHLKGSDPGTVPTKGWIWEKKREEAFTNLLRAKVSRRNELSVEALEMAITEACDESLREGKGPRYWWTTEVVDRRRECIRVRRLLPRQARRPNIDPTDKGHL